MPKLLFYSGTAFCFFVALSNAAAALAVVQGESLSLIAVGADAARAPWAVVVALVAGIAVATLFLRMAALVAARNLFAAFVAVFAVAAAAFALVWLLFVQGRMLRRPEAASLLAETHLASVLMLGYFVALMLLALRPYFRVQASRVLSVLVFLPLPLMLLLVSNELIPAMTVSSLPAPTPALAVYLAVLATLFFAIAVHCVRHRYLFLEMTNLRELLDSRVDPASRAARRTIGGIAFDS